MSTCSRSLSRWLDGCPARRKMLGKQLRAFGGNRMTKLTEAHTKGPSTPATRDLTLGQLLEQAAKRAPDRLALIAGVPDPAARRRWTYKELSWRQAVLLLRH